MAKRNTPEFPAQPQTDGEAGGMYEVEIGDAAEPQEDTDKGFDPDQFAEPTATLPESVGSDPFNADELRLAPDQMSGIGGKKMILTVDSRAPDKAWFCRVHPDPNYTMATAVIELKDERETYLIARHLREELKIEPTYKSILLCTAITRQGELFLWKVPLPGPDGKRPSWIEIPMQAVEMAKTKWVRMAWSQQSRKHEVYIATATAKIPPPEWPELTFNAILKLAYRDKYIDNIDHPVLRQLRGGV